MPTSAFALALAAAFVHALWNLLIARAKDVEAATAVALVVSIVAFAPVAVLFFWELEAAVWPYLLVTGALQLLYFVLLAGAYRRAELSVVYPVARGLAPLFVLAVAVLALGRGTSLGQAAGVCVVALGVLLVRGVRTPTRGPGLLFGLAIAATIAAYTLVDKEGIRYASPVVYLELSMIAPALLYAGAVARVRGVGAVRAELSAAAVVAGLATFVAYALVLAALERAPAASVAAVRETSVVIAAGLAALVLGERVGPARLLGAALVSAGIALLSLT